MAMIDEHQIELKKIAMNLTIAMLDNHNDDWDDDQTAAAFKKIYETVRQA